MSAQTWHRNSGNTGNLSSGNRRRTCSNLHSGRSCCQHTDLKIRASWGQTGNQGISNSARYSTYIADYGSDRLTSTAYDIYGVGSGIYPSGFRLSQTGGS